MGALTGVRTNAKEFEWPKLNHSASTAAKTAAAPPGAPISLNPTSSATAQQVLSAVTTPTPRQALETTEQAALCPSLGPAQQPAYRS